jgi:hypothetical protein
MGVGAPATAQKVFQFQNCDSVARVEFVELTSEPA